MASGPITEAVQSQSIPVTYPIPDWASLHQAGPFTKNPGRVFLKSKYDNSYFRWYDEWQNGHAKDEKRSARTAEQIQKYDLHQQEQKRIVFEKTEAERNVLYAKFKSANEPVDLH